MSKRRGDYELENLLQGNTDDLFADLRERTAGLSADRARDHGQRFLSAWTEWLVHHGADRTAAALHCSEAFARFLGSKPQLH